MANQEGPSESELNEFKDGVRAGDYSELQNGNEVYHAPNGMRIKISDQEGADLVAPPITPEPPTVKEDQRAQVIHDATHGSVGERAIWRSPDGKFSNGEQPGARLSFTPEQIEEAKKEMEEALAVQDKDLIAADLAGKNFSDSLAELMPEDEASRYRKAPEIASNDAANEGIVTTKPLSPTGQDFFARQDQIAEQAKVDAAHQEALDKNARLNEGFHPTKPLSPTGQDFFARQDQIAQEAKREDELEVFPPYHLAEAFEKRGIQFEPSLTIAGRRDGSERLMVVFSKNTHPRVGFDEIAEALATKRETPDGRIVITYLGGRTQNNGKPSYSTDIILNPDQVTALESLVNTVNSDRDTIVKDLKRENFTSSLDELMTPDDAKRYENAFYHLEDMAKADAMKAENGGLTPEQQRINDLQAEIDRLYNILRDNGITVPPVEPPVPPVEPPVPPVEPPVPPVEPPVPPVEPPVPPVGPLPGPAGADASAQLAELQNQLRELRGQNTPEQRSAELGRGLSSLDAKLAAGENLTDAEKILYFDLLRQKTEIDRQISVVEQEDAKKRSRKEKIIKIVAGVAGVGVALVTPAIGIAAVLGVTLGGRWIGKGLKSWGEKLRTQSKAMKYESRDGKTFTELAEMDKRQKRREWWANRLGEASAVLIGGTTGYAIGTAVEGIFGDGFAGKLLRGEGLDSAPTTTTDIDKTTTNTDTTTTTTDTTTTTTTSTDTTGLGGDVETWLPKETFNASDLGWDYNKMGWLGDRVHLTNLGGSNGMMQGEFFQELSRLVPKEQLMGQANGDIVNQFLIQAYNKLNPVQAAQKAAEVLGGL